MVKNNMKTLGIEEIGAVVGCQWVCECTEDDGCNLVARNAEGSKRCEEICGWADLKVCGLYRVLPNVTVVDPIIYYGYRPPIDNRKLSSSNGLMCNVTFTS